MAKITETTDDGKGHITTKQYRKNAFWIWIGALLMISACAKEPALIIPTVLLVMAVIWYRNVQKGLKE
jgi:hypothetical protein